jgi:hypothetical protein
LEMTIITPNCRWAPTEFYCWGRARAKFQGKK